MKIAALFLIVFALGCISNDNVIGGQTENGCLVAAGYSWNETVHACIREWELNSLEKVAAQKAALSMNETVTILDVTAGRCAGCYLIQLKTNKEKTVIIDGWEVSNTKNLCTLDEECVPLPVCHPKDCINNVYEPNFDKPEVCTEVFFEDAAYKPEDCTCVQNRCTNKNLVI